MIVPILKQTRVGISIAAARKHLRLTAILVSTSVCAGVVWYLWGPRVYRSSTLVEFTDSQRALPPVTSPPGAPHTKLLKQLNAPQLIERTARKLGLKGHAREIQSAYIYKTAVRQEAPNSVTIEVWSATAELARNWTKTLLGEILADQDEHRRHDRDDLAISLSGVRNLRAERRSPNWKEVAILSVLGGLLFAVGVPLFLEFVRPAVTNVAEAELLLSVPALGSLPHLDPNAMRRLAAKTSSVDPGALLESAHVTRHNLFSSDCLATTPQVMMVTSALPHEGRTVTSAALARSFAEAGWKTLLLDADLHRPGVHRFFGYRTTPGLIDLLLGNISQEKACRPTAIEGLTLLNAGSRVEDDTNVSITEQLGQLVTELRTKFDRIVIDAPAVLSFDPVIEHGHVDGVVFVIRSGRLSRRHLKNALAVLRINEANLCGLVLNHISAVSLPADEEHSPAPKTQTANGDHGWCRASGAFPAGHHS